MLPDQFPYWSQTSYEWVFEEIYAADFSTLIKATCPHYLLYSHSALQIKAAVAKCSPLLRLEKE